VVLVKSAPALSSDQTVWDMAEFFIVRRYRRRRIGTAVAHRVWNQVQGRWQVRVMASNAACLFWAHAISAYTGEAIPGSRVEKDGKAWLVFTFESKSSSFTTTPA
jgi:predicted acetyltransferase